MEKLEIRGSELYKIKEEKVVDMDVEREVAILEETISEAQARLDILKSYKVKKDGQIQADVGTAIKKD